MELKKDLNRRNLYRAEIEKVAELTEEQAQGVERVLDYLNDIDFLLTRAKAPGGVDEIIMFDAGEVMAGLEEHKAWAVSLLEDLELAEIHFTRRSWKEWNAGAKAMCEHWVDPAVKYESGKTAAMERALLASLERHKGEQVAWTGNKRDTGKRYHADGVVVATGQEVEVGVWHKRMTAQGRR